MKNANYNRPAFKAPLYIAWEVTLTCNANCLHCYSASGAKIKHPNELNTEQAFTLIDQLADAGLLILAFSGGEPLIRKDIYSLIRRAVSNNLVVNIASNGSLIKKEVALKLKEHGVRSVTISLDAASSKLHDEFRDYVGLFDKAIAAIKLLVKHEVRVVVSFTPTRLNYKEGPKVVELAHKLGADAVNMSQFVPAGRGTINMSLAPSLLRKVILDWIEMRRKYKGKIEIIWHDCRVSLLVPKEDQDKYSGCGAGKLTARITSNGLLTPCVFLSTSAGDLKEKSFDLIWNDSSLLNSIRNRELLSGNCKSCEHKENCGGCRAVSMAHHGSPLKGDASCWINPEQISEL